MIDLIANEASLATAPGAGRSRVDRAPAYRSAKPRPLPHRHTGHHKGRPHQPLDVCIIEGSCSSTI